jgi:hypothetical protein
MALCGLWDVQYRVMIRNDTTVLCVRGIPLELSRKVRAAAACPGRGAELPH